MFVSYGLNVCISAIWEAEVMFVYLSKIKNCINSSEKQVKFESQHIHLCMDSYNTKISPVEYILGNELTHNCCS